MMVTLNMSKEVYEYFKNYDLSEVANVLLEQYDFTSMPATSGKREIERVVNITDPIYINLYKIVGPRSKKISLSRLFEFAYNMDILGKPGFKVKPTGREDNPLPSLLTKAYHTLLKAEKYSDDPYLRELKECVYGYLQNISGGKKNG